MNDRDIELLFSYHAPTAETAPHYAAIRAAEAGFVTQIDSIGTTLAQDLAEGADPTVTSPGLYGAVARVVAAFARSAPHPRHDYVGHYAAGVIALTLARNAVNEAIATRKDTDRLLAKARSEAQEARWLFSGSVAIGAAAGAGS